MVTKVKSLVRSSDSPAAHDPEVALRRLPPATQQLNRIYLRRISERALLSSIDAATWLGHEVTVFLRHDRVAVFAIVCGQSVAMADFVTLTDVSFHVDERGRIQSNAGQGPLPNTHTVHAWLKGRLLSLADHGSTPNPVTWEPIIYHPLKCTAFVREADGRPIYASDRAELVPGKRKVWCPRLQKTEPDSCGGDLPS